MLLGGTERRTRFAGGQEWPQRAGYLYKLEERVGRTGLLDSADEHTRGDEKNTGFFSYVCMYVCMRATDLDLVEDKLDTAPGFPRDGERAVSRRQTLDGSKLWYLVYGASEVLEPGCSLE